MADPRRSRLRRALAWGLTLLIAAIAVVDLTRRDDDHLVATASDDGVDEPRLRILMISDAEVGPGDAVVVRFDNADPDVPLLARIGGASARIVDRQAHAVVVQVPPEAPPGRAPLRLVQGDRKSKAWDLQVRTSNHGTAWGKTAGGLALFFYGFGVLAAGFRALAGRRLRDHLGRLTAATGRSLGLGVALGAATQLTTTASAVAVGLIEARLLALAPTVAVLVGAQLGGALVGALLPLGFAAEALPLVAVGVTWTLLADGRRGRALGQAVLGVGLVLLGLHLVQTGVEPLFADPKLLPFVGYLRDDGLGPVLLAAGVGVLGGLVLQGPGPVYGLALGLAQVSGALTLATLLAILAGASLGAALGVAIVASATRRTRALALPHLAFGVFAAVAGLALAPAAIAVARAVAPGDPAALDYHRAVMATHLSPHLAVAFAASQLGIAAAWTLVAVPALSRRVIARGSTADGPGDPIDGVLTAAFASYRATVDACLATTVAGDHLSRDVDAGLADTRRAIEQAFAAAPARPTTALQRRQRRAAVGTVQIQRAMERLVAVTALGVERGLALTADDLARLTALHDLAAASLAALAAATAGTQPLDLEAARGREIEMNQLEASGGERPSPAPGPHRQSSTVPLGVAELVDAYEHLGNHLFRVARALIEDDDDELA
ncbi:MAG: Na/Pi symporter [Kofleriaceae bacterium]